MGLKSKTVSVTFKDVAAERDYDRREQLIEELLQSMKLDEKITLMGGKATLPVLMNYGSATFLAGGCKRLGIPEISFSDGPRGVMLNHSTCFPVSMARGATWDPALEERVGSAMGIEARAQGANLSGSVCINILRHPGWGRSQETYGEDMHHLGEMGSGLVRGLQKHIMACAKHFAANSIENSRFWVDVRMDDRTLYEVYLPHFKKCIDAGAMSVMGAYNRLNGPHCCHSKRLLTEILKEEWGFDGFAISDWTFGLRGSDAADAGLDIEMPNAVFFGLPLRARALAGTAPKDAIDDAARRIIRKLADYEHMGDGSDYSEDKVACKKHTRLALEVARKGTVLLKNENGILPIDCRSVSSIAVVGALADTENIGDSGSSNLHPPYVKTPLEGIRERATKTVQINYVSGTNKDELRSAAREADMVIIVAGLCGTDEGEFIPFLTKGGDRSSLSLSDSQEEMIIDAANENPNCIVILEGGSALTMEAWIDRVPAVLMAWYPGMEGGTALAEIIFGDVNPSGKLPISFPRSQSQLPHFNKWTRRIKYDLLHGYRYLEAGCHEPLFPFGFGLSYTEFKYSNLDVKPGKAKESDTITVTCDVENIGDRDGEEVVQLYVGCPDSKIERAPKELKAFAKVNIEEGEKKTVKLELKVSDLAYYDMDSRSWQVEKGGYEIHVGSSSSDDDIYLVGELTVE